MTLQIDDLTYQAAHTAAVLVDRSDLGLLKIGGETRLDLLHRMSTQAVANLKAGEGAATVLTTDIGRIIDRVLVYAAGSSVYVLTGENNAANIARYLMGYVFFRDDFHPQDISAHTAVFAVYGPQAPHFLGELAGFPEVDIPLHHWREAEIGGVTAYLHRTDPINGHGYFVMAEEANREQVWQTLQDTGLVVAGKAAYDYLRVEAGLPRFGHELTQEYIPLEAGLWADVSFTKGCYIGQEVIARMESRGKLAKRLVGLRPEGPMEEGATLLAGGKSAGTITSVAHGPQGPLALGYVRTAVLETGADLSAAGGVAVLIAETVTR